MPWIRLDDQFPDHPKIVTAGPMAGWLFVCGLSYSARYLTDGFIPTTQVHRLADIEGAMDLAARLVDVGLWEVCDGGYRIHDYLDYQPSAEKVKAERAATAKRQADWRDKHRNGVSNAVTNTVRNAPRNGTVTPAPYPSRPNNDKAVEGSNPSLSLPDEKPGAGAPAEKPDDPPVDDQAKSQPKERPVRATPKPAKRVVPADFAVSAEMREQAVGYGVPSEIIDGETEKFLDHFRSKGESKADWNATWRNWMRRWAEFNPQARMGRSVANGRSRTDEAGAKLAAFQSISRGEHRLEP